MTEGTPSPGAAARKATSKTRTPKTTAKVPRKPAKAPEPDPAPYGYTKAGTPRKRPLKPGSKGPGRHHGLTPERSKTITDLLALGNYLETACRMAGTSPSTVYAWIDRGNSERERLAIDDQAKPDPDETVFRDFTEAVEKARASAEARAVAVIQKAAAMGTWQAAAWFLERTAASRFGRVDRNEISGPGGGPVPVTVSTEELERKVAAVMAKRAGK